MSAPFRPATVEMRSLESLSEGHVRFLQMSLPVEYGPIPFLPLPPSPYPSPLTLTPSKQGGGVRGRNGIGPKYRKQNTNQGVPAPGSRPGLGAVAPPRAAAVRQQLWGGLRESGTPSSRWLRSRAGNMTLGLAVNSRPFNHRCSRGPLGAVGGPRPQGRQANKALALTCVHRLSVMDVARYIRSVCPSGFIQEMTLFYLMWSFFALMVADRWSLLLLFCCCCCCC